MIRLFYILLLSIALCCAVRAEGWRALDRMRHEAVLGGWTLSVDAGKGRLVSAVPPGGTNVLLSGGHRVWLGPQVEWPAFWPPPQDWENGPATANLSCDGKELSLALPHSDSRFPKLLRRYRLAQGCLEMTVSWQPVPGHPGYQAVQILQTRRETIAYLTQKPLPGVPKGFGLLALGARPGNDLGASAPADIVTDLGGNRWRLGFSGREEKIGVPAQPLEARFEGSHGLRLSPASHVGRTASGPVPDSGLFTQVYFGDSSWAMVELEQLSPRLQADRQDVTVESTVRLEILPPMKSP